MFNENCLVNAESVSRSGLVMNEGAEALAPGTIIGEFKDTIYIDGKLAEIREGRNTIVNSIGKLIACLFKSQAGYTGLGYWAVGSGVDTWDAVNPPVATVTDTGCTNEIGRKAITTSNIKFLDASNLETASITNKIQITVTFTENDCNGVWREFSIFGGNATTTRGSGIPINHKTHGVMVKTSSMVVERQIRFTFN